MFLDVFVDLDVVDLLAGFGQQLLTIRELETRVVGHDLPATERLVVTALAVDGHADVHVAREELLRGRGQSLFERAEHDFLGDVLLARQRIDQQ